MSWYPTATLESLRLRAGLLARLRQFFAERDVLEVETPLLCNRGVTDVSIEPLMVPLGVSLAQPRYLQSSPEYAMKRLLAAFGEPIFQISKAFRDGEAGRRHNPEFSLLEWYRPGFDHHELMVEVEDLLRYCLGDCAVHRYSYRQLFQSRLQVDPFNASVAELEALARAHLDPGNLSGDREMWLDLLMSHVLEPALADQGMCFIYDYPAAQAALARIVADGDVMIGQRFEVYVHGVELANGYCELTDAKEQGQRFAQDNVRRRERGQPEHPVDEHLLAALEHGLPHCSGVALGIDRLLMLAGQETDISAVLAFAWDRA